MLPLLWIVLCLNILNGSLTVGASLGANENSPKLIIVGAGVAGIAAASKLIENGYDNIVILEAGNRMGGRVHSIPFGKGYIDMGAQWCEGQGTGEGINVVFEMVKDDFEFGDNAIRPENTRCYTSDAQLVDQNKFNKLLNLSDAISYDFENMVKFDKSLGEFFDINYRMALQSKDFEGVDQELADQFKEFSEKRMNSLYASETWYNLSAKLIGHSPKKLPDPSKALPVDDKIQLNKEVTNIDWTSNEVVVVCADGSEYRADHVIVTVSLGYLKRHHRTLFTPQLPDKKINAIEHTGYGTLGKIFLEFEEPFWPTNIDDWGMYTFLWKKEDLDKITGTEREWVTEIAGFVREDAQPNIIGAFTAGKLIDQFETISDEQLIDDCMWLMEKFLGRSLPRPINMRRSRWKTNKHFFGSYSYSSMDTQLHDVGVNDLGETVYSEDKKPVVYFGGEATDEFNSGYVHGAVSTGWRVANDILDYYKSSQQ